MSVASVPRHPTQLYESIGRRDLIEIGAYKPGTNARLDQAVLRMPAIEAFLRQGVHETSPMRETRELLALVAQGSEGSR